MFSTWIPRALICGAGCWVIAKLLLERRRVTKLRGRVNKQLSEREKQLAKFELKLKSCDTHEIQERSRITAFSFTELLEKLRSGKLSAVQVLCAYQYRALQAHQQTNCLHSFIEDADALARDLDQSVIDGVAKGPLFGIPISVKECFSIKNCNSPMGLAQYLGYISTENASIITILQKMGAVPFCLTNMPQSGLCFGSTNPIYGTTTHPMDSSRSPGGSSAGEGSLLALNGSILGLGTDVGGSVRMPAHFCGITALKPTGKRLTLANMGAPTTCGRKKGFLPGRPYIISTWGPMARDVDTLVFLMKLLLEETIFSLDPSLIPKSFDISLFENSSPMTIGYYTSTTFLDAVPACKRAILDTKSALESRGHRLVEFVVPDATAAVSLYYGACLNDGGAYLSQILHDDLPDGAHEKLFSLGQFGIPVQLRRLLAHLPSAMVSPKVAAVWRGFAGNCSELRQTYESIEHYRATFMKQWQGLGLDGMICPPLPCTPLPALMPPQLFPVCSYSFIFNMLDYPAGVVPVSTVTAEDESTLASMPVPKEWIQYQVNSGSMGTINLPVGVQCVALPYREEICLKLMKEVEVSRAL